MQDFYLKFSFEISAKPASSSLLPDHETCGVKVPNKIYGGTKTDIREFPWLVLVENCNSSMFDFSINR